MSQYILAKDVAPTSSAWSLTASSHLKTMYVQGIVCRVSQRIGILRLVKRVFVDTSVLLRCNFSLKFCSPNPWVFYSAVGVSCWMYFVLIRVYCSCVIDVMLLGWEFWTRIIRTLITICWASFHLLLLEFDISELQPSSFIGILSIKV